MRNTLLLKRTTPFILCLLTLVLSGCHHISPGMKIDESSCSQLKFVEAPPFGRIRIVEISPELICQIEEKNLIRTIDPTIFTTNEPSDYLIEPSDTLSIMVWAHPELNNPTNSSANFEQLGFTVNRRGKIFFPYIGEVCVAGKTVDEIRETLTAELVDFVVHPVVSVNVLQYRSQFVNVIGEVNLPSQVSITDIPLTPLDAISKAGGATFQGDLQHVVIKRGEESYVINMLPTPFSACEMSIHLVHKDVVYVPSKVNNQVYVLGEVRMPQSLIMDCDTMTLSNALARASGVDPFSSNPELCFVFREDDEGQKIAYHLDARSPAALLLANKFPLKRQDIIYVGTYEPAFLNRIMTNFLSTTKAIADLSWSASNINEVINKYNQNNFNNKNSAFYNEPNVN